MDRKICYYGSSTKRGKDLANSLDAVYLLSSIDSKQYKGFYSKIIPYFKVIFKDFKKLLHLKPDCLIYEHSGLIQQSIVIVLFNLFFKRYLVIDCHTNVYQPSVKLRKIISYFSNKSIDISQLLIVHNEETLKLKDLHENMIVVESKVPSIETNKKSDKFSKKKIVFITRFHDDEPILEMLDTCKLFTDDYQFYFTGNYENKLNISDIKNHNNVILTGFISDKDYHELLSTCDVIVALTTRDFTLLYSGREAIAVQKPLVISDNDTCRNYFTKGSVFVENNAVSIKMGIINALENKNTLINDMSELNIEKEDLWNRRIADLKQKIEEVTA